MACRSAEGMLPQCPVSTLEGPVPGTAAAGSCRAAWRFSTGIDPYTQVFYKKVKAECYRYFAGLTNGGAKSTAAGQARAATLSGGSGLAWLWLLGHRAWSSM